MTSSSSSQEWGVGAGTVRSSPKQAEMCGTCAELSSSGCSWNWPLTSGVCWTGERFNPNFCREGAKNLKPSCTEQMSDQDVCPKPLPNIYSYISSYPKAKQTKHKARNNRKQSRLHSHNPVSRYGWANLKHPCLPKGDYLSPFSTSSLLLAFFTCVSSRAHLTVPQKTEFTNLVKNWSIIM